MNGRWSVQRTTFLSSIASVSERRPQAPVALGHARDTDAAIAETGDEPCTRAAGGIVAITAITRTDS